MKLLKSNISKMVRDIEMVSLEVKKEVIYGLSDSEKIFDPRWPLGFKGQGQTLKTLKSFIGKTVRDRKMMSIEIK